MYSCYWGVKVAFDRKYLMTVYKYSILLEELLISDFNI